MTTKEKILKLFETSRDVYFSGEDIAPKLCCKTNAMCESIEAVSDEKAEIKWVNDILFVINRSAAF